MNNKVILCAAGLCLLVTMLPAPLFSANDGAIVTEFGISLENGDWPNFCSYDNTNCTGDIYFNIELVNDCPIDTFFISGAIDTDNDLIPDMPVAIENLKIEATLPIGTYTLFLEGGNGCGDTDSIAFAFQVVDCKPPHPVCISGLAIELTPVLSGNPEGYRYVTVWATDFIASDIQDCSGILGYSIYKTIEVMYGEEIPTYPHPGVDISCEDPATTLVWIYAWDDAYNPYAVQPDGSVGGHNYDYCQSYIHTLDWEDACDETLLYIHPDGDNESLFCVTATDTLVEFIYDFDIEMNCTDTASLTLTAEMDYGSNGDIDTVLTISGQFPNYYITDSLPIGEHILYLTAENSCSGSALEHTTFSVVDCNSSISGQIATENAEGIPNVFVSIEGTLNATPITDGSGTYSVSNLTFGSSLTLTPFYDVQPTNGISVLDIIALQRHLLGIELLDSPYKKIAADVNNSGTITVQDIIQMKKVILGQSSSFTGNTSWRFIDASYVFENSDPLTVESFPESIVIDFLSGNVEDMDFIGVKIGDLNGSVVIE